MSWFGLLLWVMCGIAAVRMFWSLAADPYINGWGIFWAIVFAPISLFATICWWLAVYQLPTKHQLEIEEKQKEPQWIKDAREEANRIMKQ